MFKKISAALLVASMLTAPALAATVIKTEKAPITKSVTFKRSPMNAQAKVVVVKKVRHHGHRMHVRHHRAHKHVGAVVIKKMTRVSAAPAAKTVIVKKKI